jgi:transcriptional regulator with XRE-family HTH domain
MITDEKAKSVAFKNLARLPRSYLSIYWLIRRHKKWTQYKCAETMGITRSVWARRERCRCTTRAVELVALREGFELSWEEMGRFIEQAASADIIIVQNTV